MKLSLNDLINSKGSLTKLAKTDIPIKTAYWLNKDIQKLNNEFLIFDELKKKLFEKYGENKDNQIIIKPENIESFQKDFNELLKSEIEVEIHKIKLEMLGEIKLSPFDLTALQFIIEE